MIKFIYLLTKRSIGQYLKLFKFYKKSNFLPPFGLIVPNLDQVKFGKNFSIGEYSQIYCQDPENGSKVSFGDNVAINANVMINADSGGEIIIGNNVLIGPQVIIRASNHGFARIDMPIRNQPTISGKITIEDDVWIASNTVITADVRIGKGSIIGAGSVVTKDIPPHSIAVGIPAKVIKSRV